MTMGCYGRRPFLWISTTMAPCLATSDFQPIWTGVRWRNWRLTRAVQSINGGGLTARSPQTAIVLGAVATGLKLAPRRPCDSETLLSLLNAALKLLCESETLQSPNFM